MATRSHTHNVYGIGAAKDSDANIQVNEYTGLNQFTKSTSAAATISTWYKDTSTGVARASETINTYGLEGAARSVVSNGNMQVNETTGINIYSKAVSAVNTTETWYEGTYGTATTSKTKNNYGLTYAAETSRLSIQWT